MDPIHHPDAKQPVTITQATTTISAILGATRRVTRLIHFNLLPHRFFVQSQVAV